MTNLNNKGKFYKAGDFLYGIPSNEEVASYHPENQRVFIYNGTITGDGYGMMLGWHDGKICKSTGINNFMWGGDVRYATTDEIEQFIESFTNQENIKNY